MSRAQRRRAEKEAGRRHLARRTGQVVAGLLVIAGIVSLAVLAIGGDSTARHRASAIPAATASGAGLADPTLATSFLGAAASDLAAVTTYDYRHLDDALNAGLAVTTGTYREAYRGALTGDLARTASAEHVVHTFELLDIGIGRINARGTRASVLAFGRERITDDATGPDVEVSPITLCATIRRSGNHFRITGLTEGTDPGLPPGGADLPVAAAEGRAEVINLLSYRRSEFDADLRKAVNGATSPLREQIQKSAAGLRAAMTSGKYDTTGTVTATAVVRADTDTVTLLVAADSAKLTDAGARPASTQLRYEVTVTRTQQGWLTSRVSSVDGG